MLNKLCRTLLKGNTISWFYHHKTAWLSPSFCMMPGKTFCVDVAEAVLVVPFVFLYLRTFLIVNLYSGPIRVSKTIVLKFINFISISLICRSHCGFMSLSFICFHNGFGESRCVRMFWPKIGKLWLSWMEDSFISSCITSFFYPFHFW